MSVNSVPTGLPPPYSLLSGNNSQSARSASFATSKGLFADPFAKPNGSQQTGAEVDDAAQDASVTSGGSDATDAGELQSSLEQELRARGATAGKFTSGTSDESRSSGSSPGIALYQRISQYGNSESSASSLLKSWNTIMQGGQDADSAAAAFVKALSQTQNQTPGFESGVLDLTA